MPTTLLSAHVAAILAELAQHASATVLPRSGRGVVHVLYGGAHLYRPGSAAKLGALARASMTAFGKDDRAFARVVGLADSVPFNRADPLDPSNRRISITVMTKTAADAAVGDAPPGVPAK